MSCARISYSLICLLCVGAIWLEVGVSVGTNKWFVVDSPSFSIAYGLYEFQISKQCGTYTTTPQFSEMCGNFLTHAETLRNTAAGICNFGISFARWAAAISLIGIISPTQKLNCVTSTMISFNILTIACYTTSAAMMWVVFDYGSFCDHDPCDGRGPSCSQGPGIGIYLTLAAAGCSFLSLVLVIAVSCRENHVRRTRRMGMVLIRIPPRDHSLEPNIPPIQAYNSIQPMNYCVSPQNPILAHDQSYINVDSFKF
eukprot:PhF_6_TR3328/c0_g1_i2/m.4700